MALRYFSISKETTFEGRTERFANVYLYEMSSTTTASLNAQIDALIAAERPVHSTTVNFVEARAYTTFGLNGITDPGSTFVVRPITGTPGTAADSASWYRELAFLCKWELPRKVGLLGALGRQRSLKKWLHTCSSFGIPSAGQAGTGTIGTTPTALATYMSAVSTLLGSPLVAPDGSLPISGTGTLHNYVEHRQFPRGRKEA